MCVFVCVSEREKEREVSKHLMFEFKCLVQMN